MSTSRSWVVAMTIVAAVLGTTASAQAQAVEEVEKVETFITLQALEGFVETNFLAAATAPLLVSDLSFSKLGPVQTVGPVRLIALRAEVLGDDRRGWTAAVSPATIPSSRGGDIHEARLIVLHDPSIQTEFAHVRVVAETFTPNGTLLVQEANVVVKVRPFYGFFTVQSRALPALAKPYDALTYPVLVTNAGLFPDTFEVSLSVEGSKWLAAAPASTFTLFPKESRLVNVSILTPAYQLYEPFDSTIVTVEVRSIFEPGSPQFVPLVATYSGVYFPGAWWPTLGLFLVLGALVVARRRTRGERHRQEEGAPRDPRKDPGEMVALAALEAKDPEAARTRAAELTVLHRERVREYRAHRTEHLRREASLEKAERTKYREIQRLRRRREREVAEDRKAKRKEERKRLRAAAKERRQREAALRKEHEHREKELRKKQKEAEAARRKAMKRQAKEDEKAASERQKKLKRLEREKARKVLELRKEAARKRREQQKD